MKGSANTFHEDMSASTIMRKTAMILSSEMCWHIAQKGVLVDDEDILIHPHHLRPNDYRSQCDALRNDEVSSHCPSSVVAERTV